MFLTVFVGVFFFAALIVWIFFEYYSLNESTFDAVKYRCRLLRDGTDGDAPDDASEPRIVVLVAKTPTTKFAARIVLGFAAALVGLWIWGFVDAADLEYTARMNTDSEKAGAVLVAGLAHGVRIVQLNPVSRSGYLCFPKISKYKKARSENADEETAPKRRGRRHAGEDEDQYRQYRRR